MGVHDGPEYARRKAKSLYQTTFYWRKYIMSNLNQDRGFFVDDATGFTLGSYTCDPEDISYHIPNDLDDRLDIIFDDFCYDCDTDGIHVSGRLRIEFLDDLPAFSTQLHSQVDRLIKHLQEN
jgi:hypothetical protein